MLGTSPRNVKGNRFQVKRGDVVYHLKRPHDIVGIIIYVHAGLFATWFSVMWPNGVTEICTSEEVRVFDEKR